jgi:hypothetical protein
MPSQRFLVELLFTPASGQQCSLVFSFDYPRASESNKRRSPVYEVVVAVFIRRFSPRFILPNCKINNIYNTLAYTSISSISTITSA